MMTVEEKCRLYELAEEAENRGDLTEAEKISKTIPLSAISAKIVKEVWGIDFIKNGGFNLSEAEEVYGKNWLDQ